MYWSLENVPWTNLHDLNLDWIVNTMKQTVEQWIAYRLEMDGKYADFTTQINSDFDDFTEQVNSDFDNFTTGINNWKTLIESEFSDLQTYVQNYFDNLDLNESTRYVINQMIASGEFVEVLNPSIVSAVESWLAEHITPTTPALDDTLTIAGAAADSQAVGIKIASTGGMLNTEFTIGRWINTSGNATTSSERTRMATVSYIPVMPGDTITYKLESGNSYINCISFYSNDKTYVHGISNSGTNGTLLTVTVPNNAYYARFSSRTDIDTYVSFNTGILNYFKQSINYNSLIKTIHGIPFISGHRLDPEGYYTVTSDDTRWATAEYIPVAEGATITYQLETGHPNICAVAFYDINKHFINGITNTGTNGERFTSTIPAGCKYVRFSTRKDIQTFVNITPYYNPVNNTPDISISDIYPKSIDSLRTNLPTLKTKITLPDLPFINKYPIEVYGDGYSFYCKTELSIYKNNSANTFYAKDSSTLLNAVNNAESGDTIYLQEAVYVMPPIRKSLNIIALNKGTATFVKTNIGYATETTSPNVWKFKLSSTPTNVYFKDAHDAPIKLIGQSSTSGVIAATGTYYYDSANSLLYVHLPNNTPPTNKNVFVDTDPTTTISIRSNNNDIKVYLEGINVWGNGWCLYANGSFGEVDIIAVDCCFWHSSLYNVVALYGANGYFQRCEAAYGYRDGFNYHASDNDASLVSNAIEIDCIGHDNGAEANPETERSNNGSTCHEGGKVLRINGFYYRNYGGNIAETNADTISWNYGCFAFDSRSTTDNWSGDMWTGENAVQYVYGCKCVGDSLYNLDEAAGGTSTIYYDKYTEFKTSRGNVVKI